MHQMLVSLVTFLFSALALHPDVSCSLAVTVCMLQPVIPAAMATPFRSCACSHASFVFVRSPAIPAVKMASISFAGLARIAVLEVETGLDVRVVETEILGS